MLLCGLAFAGANQASESGLRHPGRISADELAWCDLSRCELAVLSACETSVGIRRAGQGIASLQQALHTAGAKYALTSLWKVSDEATRVLMTEFYRRIWEKGEPFHRALRGAKRSLREARTPDGRPRWGPADWAGWVLSGGGLKP